MRDPRSRFIEPAGQRRHVLEWGEPGLPAVVLQHGMRDQAHSWTWLAETLADRFHVIAPDLRGHGDSQWSADRNYTLSAFVLDLADVVDAIGLKRFDLVGHSLGGHIALRYTASFPESVRSLIAIEGIELPVVRQERESPLPYPERIRDWAIRQRGRRLHQPRTFADAASAECRMAAANPAIDPVTIAHLARTGITSDDASGWRWKYDDACRDRAPEDQRGRDLDDILRAVTCPTLLAYGEDSWIDPPPPERLALLASHRLTTFANASHWLHHQRRAEFCRMAGEFLTDPAKFMEHGTQRYA